VLELGLVLLFLAAVTATLYGGVVPEYRTAAGDQVADRTLAAASQQVQQAVPPNGSRVSATATVDLPATIRGRHYEVRVSNRTLVLDHPRPGVDARARLALPPSGVAVTGNWSSGRPARVVVEQVSGGLAVRLAEGSP
jgi:hypothetical protein